VDVGNVGEGTLFLENPTEARVTLSVAKIPQGVALSAGGAPLSTKFVVPASGVVQVGVSWTPSQTKGTREVLYFKMNRRFRLGVVIFGNVSVSLQLSQTAAPNG
jgi:hypothetical protein